MCVHSLSGPYMICRLIGRAKEEPAALPAFLDKCLGTVAGAGAPAQLVSPSAFMLLRDIALMVTQSYLEAIGGATHIASVLNLLKAMHLSAPLIRHAMQQLIH